MNQVGHRIGSIPALVRGDDADHVVVVVHGLYSSKDDPVLDALAVVAERQGAQVLGFDLPHHGERASARGNPGDLMPWEAVHDTSQVLDWARARWSHVSLLAVSFGAYVGLVAAQGGAFVHTWLLSPLVDVRALIEHAMRAAGVSEARLRDEGTVETPDMLLSHDYLRWVREHPITQVQPGAEVLRARSDLVVPEEQVTRFAERFGAGVTWSETGEHWFHTDEQIATVTEWLTRTWGDRTSR